MSQKNIEIKDVDQEKIYYYKRVFHARNLNEDCFPFLEDYIHCLETLSFIQQYTINQHKGIKNITNGTIKGIGVELIDVFVNHNVLTKIKNYPNLDTITLNPEYEDLAQYITPVFPQILNINGLSSNKLQYERNTVFSKPTLENTDLKIRIKKIMKKNEIKEKFNLKLLKLDREILENSTIFTLDYDIIDLVLEVFLKISKVIDNCKLNNHNFLKKLPENEKYQSIFKPYLNNADYKILQCLSDINFKKGFENPNPVDIHFFDFALKTLFDFDPKKSIPYFEKKCPQTLNETEKQEWLDFPYDRSDSGYANIYNKVHALKYFSLEYLNVLSYLLNFDYLIFPLSLDLRGRAFPIVGLFSPYTKFILNQLSFYECDYINEINKPQFDIICKLFKDHFATSDYISFKQDLVPLFEQYNKENFCVVTEQIMEKLPIKDDSTLR